MIVLVAVAALASAQAADPAQSPGQAPGKTLEALQAMYDQSCQVRAYGSYDDLCSALRKQIGDAKREQARAKPQARPAAAPAQAAATPPPPAAPAALATN
jgi:hypothetical protein